jgi:cation transporter-like permease
VIASLTMLAWAYLALSIPFFITGLPSVIKAVRLHFDPSKQVMPVIAEPKKL